jgi:hypothetical protein
MIVWTTARNVAFEKICSSLTNQSDTFATQIITGDMTVIGTNFTLGTSRTINEGGETVGNTSVGSTFNHTGSTSFSSESFSSSSSASETAFQTFTTLDDEGETVTETFQSSTSNSTSGSGSFLSSSTLPAITVSKQTTTTETLTLFGTTTSSSTQQSTKATTAQASSDSNVTEVVVTEAAGTRYFSVETDFTRTRTTLTQSGTTNGNARDTIYIAEPGEVLWVVNQDPAWSEPLTDNAASTTQTTISDMREATTLVAAVNSQSIQPTSSTFTSSFTSSVVSFIQATVNNAPGFIGGITTTQQINVTTSFEEPFWNSFVFLVSRQFGVLHYGNTETAAAAWETIGVPTQTDLLASESWQRINTIRSTTVITRSINNTVGTFSKVGEGITSSCYGNTTKEAQFIGATSLIGSPPSMTIYSPAGVKLGSEAGLRFTGDGISETDVDEDGTVTIISIYTANDGELTRYTTASPVAPTWFTISSNSFTYLTTTLEDSNTVDTTITGEIGIDGATWQTIARARQNGLIGGDLAEDETALIRINRGLYKNQNGDTSFFEGDDTTYVGTKNTTYWYPISYLQPTTFNSSVFAVPRNVSTYPTFVNMP